MRLPLPEYEVATQRDVERADAMLPPTWLESVAANMGTAWDWSPIARVAESLGEEAAELRAYGGSNWYENAVEAQQQAISKEEWPNHEYYREGMEWEEGLTPVAAKYRAEFYDSRRSREAILAKQTTAQKVAGFGVQMGVGLVDPVNFIPLVGPAMKAKAIGQLGSVAGRMLVSGAEAGIGNLGANLFVGPELKRRGEDITLEDYAWDTLIGTGVGALFGGVGGAWAKHFRGEKRDAVVRGLQKAALDVEDGKPVDVAPILKDVVEAGQFNRERAHKALTDRGADAEQAETFLTHLDGLAAAQGMDADTWYRKHIADVEVGGSDAEGIRFHAMYKSKVSTAREFVDSVRSDPGGKASFFELGNNSESGHILLSSHAVNHIYKRHPNDADLAIPQIMDVLEGSTQRIEADQGKNTYGGKSYFYIKDRGQVSQVVALETVSSKSGLKSYVTTTFVDSTARIQNWINAKEVRLAPGGSPGLTQASHGEDVVQIDTSSIDTISHRGDIRKTVERLQSKAKNAAPLHVVDSFDQLPERVRAHAAGRGVEGVRAVHDGHAVYIVADALDSVDQAVALWMHEQGVHHGLRGLVGDNAQFNALMDTVFDHFGAEHLDDIRQAYGLNFDNSAHRREAAEEMLARVAEKIGRGEDLGELETSLWDRIKTWLLSFLRDHGVEVEMTDHDIAQIVRDAVRWTVDGTSSVSRRGPQRFSVDGRANGTVQFLPDGRAHVHVFDGVDLGQAGEGLSRILSERFTDFKPAERLDWRTERPEREVPDPVDAMEPEEVPVFDAESVASLVSAGRVTEEELAELHIAERGVEQAGRVAEAFRVAARCITRMGL